MPPQCHLYETAGCTKPVKRLWISSLTPDAIRDAPSFLLLRARGRGNEGVNIA